MCIVQQTYTMYMRMQQELETSNVYGTYQTAQEFLF